MKQETGNTIESQFEQLNKLKIFEIEVIDNRSKLKKCIIFNISINENKFISKHEATTNEEEKSKTTPFVEIEIDHSFTLNEHLHHLHEQCIYKLINSDFFTIN